MTILVSIIFFSLGFIAGAYMRGVAFNSQEWQILRWNNESFGYRPAPLGSLIKKNDKVIMGLPLDTSWFPSEGYKVEED